MMDFNRLKLARINNILTVLFLLVLVYLLYDLFVFTAPRISDSIKKSGTNIIHEDSSPQNAKQKSSDISVARQLDYYTQKIGAKNLFKASLVEELSNTTIAATEAQTLILKGVIAGRNPQAVIEDTKTQKTYFVVKNDKIGDIIIDSVEENKVKLKLGSEIFVLTL